MAANSRFAVAIHIMADLAIHSEKWMCSREIAGSVNTNSVVIRRILGDLQKAGLIRTQLGKAGGAQLAKNASQITLYDIYEAVGKSSVFAFNTSKPVKHCPLSCKMKSILEPIFENTEKAIERELEKVRLSQILEK